jgi:hypothetical protein
MRTLLLSALLLLPCATKAGTQIMVQDLQFVPYISSMTVQGVNAATFTALSSSMTYRLDWNIYVPGSKPSLYYFQFNGDAGARYSHEETATRNGAAEEFRETGFAGTACRIFPSSNLTGGQFYSGSITFSSTVSSSTYVMAAWKANGIDSSNEPGNGTGVCHYKGNAALSSISINDGGSFNFNFYGKLTAVAQ